MRRGLSVCAAKLGRLKGNSQSVMPELMTFFMLAFLCVVAAALSLGVASPDHRRGK
jgi:hypothetical protein